jgi:uncharacterized protein with ATP-grasp and redox domains
VKLSSECYHCIIEWVFERTSPHVAEAVRPYLRDRINEVVRNTHGASVNAGFLCNRAVFATEEFSPRPSAYYETFKQRSNERAKELLPVAEKYVEGGETERERFERACILAAAGNVAPLSAPSEVFSFREVMDILGLEEGATRAPVIVPAGRCPVIIGDVYEAVMAARRVLYVTDNAGEIGFDSLVLRAIKEMGAYVTVVVKEGAFFEDATMSDAYYFNLERIVDEIVTSKGFLVKEEASSALSRAYEMSDLIISKGTGSFEALRGETNGRMVVFMLKVKCGPIGRGIKVAEGRVVVKVGD